MKEKHEEACCTPDQWTELVRMGESHRRTLRYKLGRLVPWWIRIYMIEVYFGGNWRLKPFRMELKVEKTTYAVERTLVAYPWPLWVRIVFRNQHK